VKRNDTPLEEATTSSLEALKAFSRAMKVDFSSGEAAAIPLFKRATEIDPNFALAYGNLGLSYSGVGDTVLAIQSTTRAYELRDRVSEREKFFITAMYERHVTGDLEKERHTLELWAQSYPRDPKPHGLLSGYGSQGTGRYERAIEEAKTTIGLDPDFTFAYLNAVSSSIYLDRLDDAQKMLGAASRRGIEVPGFLFLRYVIAFLRGDRDGMRREVARAKDRRGAQELVAQAEALVLARSGQLRAARARSLEAINLAQEEGDPERRATCLTGAAVSDAFFGNAMAAKRSAMEALKVSNGRDVEYAAAFALALAGDSTRPGALANDLEKRFPEDTFVNFTYVPILHALASLQQSKPADAVEQLQVALPYELAIPPIAFDGGSFGALYGAYVRGLAYLAEHQGAQAALEFQKVLEHRGLLGVDPAGATARLQLGRALALCGDRDKAKAAYQDFFTLWKDADPDIPILNQAKAEYIRL
jgi:tetratricopeptide (TPR) repeat protein